ncbi:hypothetical protein D6829_02020, partial [Candidatus Pacearchaeota archaeon]
IHNIFKRKGSGEEMVFFCRGGRTGLFKISNISTNNGESFFLIRFSAFDGTGEMRRSAGQRNDDLGGDCIYLGKFKDGVLVSDGNLVKEQLRSPLDDSEALLR